MLRRIRSWALSLLALLSFTSPLQAAEVYRLQIDGPIGPATSDYLQRAMATAREQGADLIIITIDTPGGLDSSMRDIIKAILASPVPVVGYVTPNGARAASAGTYILYASHIAAMAPATNLGAATPVQLGGASPLPDEQQEPAPAPSDAHERKAINDAVAFIRGLAELRGRNAEWAEQAVRKAASLEAPQALESGVIDLIALDWDDLLAQLDGREVAMQHGTVTLDTTAATTHVIEPDWRSRLLAVITNPNIAYLLMIIGIYGLIFELASPGMGVGGIVGTICLLLALYALQVLPVNYAGLALLLLGVALMVGEAFAPSFGALGIGGITAFVIGSLILIDTGAPGFGISVALIGALALFSALLLISVLALIIKARRRPVVSGAEAMVGSTAEALEDFTGDGRVRAHGELWQAHSSIAVSKGERLRITALHGLHLEVSPDQDDTGGTS